jgi:peroxiredoxin family protein
LADFWQEKDSDHIVIKEMKRTARERAGAKNIDIPAGSFQTEDENQRSLLRKLFPAGENPTLWNMLEQFTAFSLDMYTHHQTYKDLRSLIDKNYNAGKFTLGNCFDFNEAFKESVFKKSFLAFVHDTMQKPANGKIEFYNFYAQCYMCMDIFGISKDKISKKNGFNNLLNDGLHSYYARCM